MPKHKKKAKSKAKKMSNEVPATKFAGEHGYEWQEGEIGIKPPPKPKPKPEAEAEKGGAVAAFGRYLKGVVTGENRRAFERVFKEAWKKRDLEKQIAQKKKLSKIKRLQAEGRKMRKKK